MRHYRPQEGYGINYRDTGCKFAPSCLNCPFPECLEVLKDRVRAEGRHISSPKKMARNREIRLAFVQGRTQREIAKEFGVHIRTVRRVLRQAMPETPLQIESESQYRREECLTPCASE